MSAPTAAPAKKKSKLKMPHLLFLMLGLILLMSLLTYIVPAGQFATDPETVALIGDEFHLLGHQTPVNIWQALNYILPGFMNSSYVISLLLISGGCVGVIMGTGAFDEMVNWALYKLQDKGVSVLVPIVFMVIAIHGGFGGGAVFVPGKYSLCLWDDLPGCVFVPECRRRRGGAPGQQKRPVRDRPGRFFQ